MKRLQYLVFLVFILTACGSSQPKKSSIPTIPTPIPTVELLIAPPAMATSTPWLSPMSATMKAEVEARNPEWDYDMAVLQGIAHANTSSSGRFEPVIAGEFRLDYITHRREKCSLSNDDCVVIDYKFTNNSSETKSFLFAVIRYAFQDGIELSYESPFNSEALTEIRPGKSITVKDGFKLRGSDPVIELEFMPLSDLFAEKIRRTITLN